MATAPQREVAAGIGHSEAIQAATRMAMLARGKADIMYLVPGELIDRVKNNPKLRLAPMVPGNWWREFPAFQSPANPFHDKRVRQAISLAIDRDAINNAECGGMGVVDGNWINNDIEYAMEWPKWPHDMAKAKQLMAEAGYPNGFNVDWMTPTPTTIRAANELCLSCRRSASNQSSRSWSAACS